MKSCPKCGSKTISFLSKDTRVDLQEDRWVLVTPMKEISLNDKYKFYCFDCHEGASLDIFRNTIKFFHKGKKQSVKFSEEELIIYQPQYKTKKIVLDLDSTLLKVNSYRESEDEADFEFQAEDYEKFTVKGFIRPYAKEFIQFLRDNDYNIEVCTASLPKDAKAKVDALGLSDVPLRTIKDLSGPYRTAMAFEKEYIKKMNGVIAVDDKPEVIYGRDNIILTPVDWIGNKEDKDLQELIKLLKDPPTKEIRFPDKFKVTLADWFFAEKNDMNLQIKGFLTLSDILKFEKILVKYVGICNHPDQSPWLNHRFNDDNLEIGIRITEDLSLKNFYEDLDKQGFVVENKIKLREFKKLIEKDKKIQEKRWNF